MVPSSHPKHATHTYSRMGEAPVQSRERMTMTMTGPICPQCGHDGSHPIMAYEMTEEGYPVLYVLHCNKCEEVWEERHRQEHFAG